MGKSTIFRIGTVNAQSLPQHWRLPAVFSSTSILAIFGMQEMDLPRYKKRAKKKWPYIVGLGPINNNTFSCPIVAKPKRFHIVEWHSKKLYDGDDGISYTRHYTEAVVEETKTDIEFVHFNLHAPVVKNDKKHQKRLDLRHHAKSVIRTAVTARLTQGFPVAITGDFNDKANWFTGLGAQFEVKRVGTGIDQIILIAHKASQRWEILSHSSINTPSDHNTLRARVRLTLL